MCELAKHKYVPFYVSNKIRIFLFCLIHTDVWSPSNIPNISSACWFVTFIDDCTQVTWIYLLKQKFKVSNVFPQLFYVVKNQSDNAKDYFNHTLKSLCQNEGIIHESLCIKTP